MSAAPGKLISANSDLHIAATRVRNINRYPKDRMPQDATLLAGCLRGEREAQRALYERYSDRLFAVARRYIPQTETAQDVLAEAWLKIFTNLSSFSGSGSLEGWMRRIVSNEALMHIRKRRLKLAELSPAVIAKHTEPVRVDARLESQDVVALLDTLPDGCRTVFNLYELEGYKHREIGELLGVSINTSKSQLILAKRKLRDAYIKLSSSEGAHLRPIPNPKSKS